MQDSTQQSGTVLEGPRAMRPDEIPAVVDLVNQIFCVATGRPPTMGEQFPQLFSPENADNLFIFTDRGRPVSHVGLWVGAIDLPGVRLPIGSMGSVCTLPEARSQGLADRLVHLALERARSQGRPLLFISGERSLYRRNGAHPAGRFRRLHLSRAQADRVAGTTRAGQPPGLAHLEPAQLSADLPLVAALHQREPVRWHRTLEEWPALVEAAGFATILRLRQQFWLVEVKGEPVACWLTGSGGSNPGDLMVLEFYGSRPALAASLPDLFRASGAQQVHLPVLEGDPLLHGLAAAGWDTDTAPVETLPGTVAVLDWPLLWRRLSPYLEERLPAQWVEARAHVRDGGRAPAAGPRRFGLETQDGELWEAAGAEALVRALFGAGAHPTTDLVPLEHPLAQALPIPLPWPQGLNYI